MKPIDKLPAAYMKIAEMRQRITELELAMLKIYDSPSSTDSIIDIAYDALNGEV